MINPQTSSLTVSRVLVLLMSFALFTCTSACDDAKSPDITYELDAEVSGDMADIADSGLGPVSDSRVGDERDGGLDDASIDASPPSDAGAELTASGDPALAHFSKGCYLIALQRGDQGPLWLGGAEQPTLTSQPDQARRVFMQATALGEYLIYDEDRRYLVLEDEDLAWRANLTDEDAARSVEQVAEQGYVYASGEWALQSVDHSNDGSSDGSNDGSSDGSNADREMILVHQQTMRALTASGSTDAAPSLGLTSSSREAYRVQLERAEGCATHPELSVDAEGEVTKTHFDDGDLFGVVDAHSHLFSQLGFGPGVHGAPFHRLGVEHALRSCDEAHGEEGRLDLWGYFADRGESIEIGDLAPALIGGRTPDFNHNTDGYPTFTDWPNAPYSSTHQTQYYRWIERAWRGGLRLIVQHAVANQVICDLQRARHPLADRYECNEMINVRRSIEAAYELERYIDAQSGGEGLGFLRIVKSPAEAREVIGAGKLAIVLGVETSNLFDCYATLTPERPVCTPEVVTERLDELYELGVRVMFPVHKYDNGFSAGDGARGILEVANLINTGHWSSYVEDCELDAPPLADRGSVVFGGLNQPRDELISTPELDMSGFASDPISALAPILPLLTESSLEGQYCRNHGLSDLGRHLIDEMMRRGMLIEMDHFSRRAYAEVMGRLEERDYPGVGTHGHHFDGRIYALGGVSRIGSRGCQRERDPQALVRDLINRVELKAEVGGYPAEGFAFDLNGFAGYPKPRFGALSPCSEPQSDPVTYPFTSYAGDVTFTSPVIGERALNFNEEGFVHLGLVPELIEDMRGGGQHDEEIEALFRSAEGYLRMWERAEERARALE